MTTSIPLSRAATAAREPFPDIDARQFRTALGHYPTGVVIISTLSDEGDAVGMVIGTFTSVSLDPPLVGFLPTRDSQRWAEIARSGKFCVNILAEDQADLCRRFSGADGNAFAGLEVLHSANGCPILPGIAGWIDCHIHQVIDAGDHHFVLGRVTDLNIGPAKQPMLFWRGAFHALATQ
ncbi:MAG: flavin reductase family protein [Sphingomonadales bacterium]|nr:flavin reductase family protein [Sphingomonadales bacterium]